MSEQKMIIANEECNFIIKNYEAIQALKECEKRADQKVPLWMKRKLKQILDLKLDGKWQVEESDDNKNVHYDQLSNETYYKDKDEVGYYFYIGNFTLEEFAVDDEDDGCQVYLCCEFSKKKKQDWKDWNNAVTEKIKNSTSAITKLGYKVFPDNEDENLVAKGLLNDLNIKALAEDPEKSIKKTADIVIRFVNDMLKYLVALPEE